jgi:hypothetical protein
MARLIYHKPRFGILDGAGAFPRLYRKILAIYP